MRAKWKVAGSIMLLGAGAGALVLGSQPAEAQGGNCIYAEHRNVEGQCYGPTTRICEGPPECPPAQDALE